MKRKLFLGLTMVATVAAQAIEVGDTARMVDLDEVIVVAQPKEQVRLRLQPVSSSVFDSEQMNRLGVRDLNQLSQYVPSFDMPAYGSRITSTMYMRGIGARINNTSVGVYYDNIPLMSKSAFNNHFYMLDRVDVLRGPQGTLYGMNTEGGLVRMYSKNPMNYQGTDIRLGLGSGLYTNAEVAHHHRPSERLAFTVAGFWQGLRGFFNNQNFDEKNDKSKEAGGKVRLVYDPTKRLRMDWTADYQWVMQNGFGYGEYDVEEDCTHDPATTIMNGYRRTMLNTGLTFSYDMPQLLFTSTTSYQYLKDRMMMDQDYVTPDYLQLEQRQKMNAVTQEFVLRSKPQISNLKHRLAARHGTLRLLPVAAYRRSGGLRRCHHRSHWPGYYLGHDQCYEAEHDEQHDAADDGAGNARGCGKGGCGEVCTGCRGEGGYHHECRDGRAGIFPHTGSQFLHIPRVEHPVQRTAEADRRTAPEH
ncbi:MAG: TonB-dependent receptor plug domain-containing protein [Prevotella sp.]|nr:TonB-dependent receptor plug domain-containing protein [Prevotella sp.]